MIKIWANRLIAGSRTWKEVPESRKAEVKRELTIRMYNHEITKELFNSILGIKE